MVQHLKIAPKITIAFLSSFATMMHSNTQENVPDFKKHISLGKHLFQSRTKLLTSQHTLKARNTTEAMYVKGSWTNRKPTPESHCGIALVMLN